jgi:hypothetical protein
MAHLLHFMTHRGNFRFRPTISEKASSDYLKMTANQNLNHLNVQWRRKSLGQVGIAKEKRINGETEGFSQKSKTNSVEFQL